MNGQNGAFGEWEQTRQCRVEEECEQYDGKKYQSSLTLVSIFIFQRRLSFTLPATAALRILDN